MTFAELILLLHVLATLFMLGLIWVVQLVHYPLMRHVDPAGFVDFEKAHQRRIALLVGPGMGLELATGLLLLIIRPAGVEVWLVWVGLALIIVNWVSTAAVQMPCHAKLERGFDPAVWRRLVQSNWLRTAAWSLRAVVVLAMISRQNG